MMTDSLGSLQQLVMRAVLQLPGEAYGAQIQLMLEETAGRTVTIGSIYVTMDRLESRGFVRSWLAAPTPARGGKAKRCYALTERGIRTLREAKGELERMWRTLEPRAVLEAP